MGAEIKILDELKVAGFIATPKRLIDVHDVNGVSIATVFLDDRYIQFHDEFTQIGCEIPIFDELMKSGYESNHS